MGEWRSPVSPSFKGCLVEVRLKVQRTNSGNTNINLGAGNDTEGYVVRSVSVPSNSDYVLTSLSPAMDSERYYISADGLYIDDIEIWTIPCKD